MPDAPLCSASNIDPLIIAGDTFPRSLKNPVSKSGDAGCKCKNLIEDGYIPSSVLNADGIFWKCFQDLDVCMYPPTSEFETHQGRVPWPSEIPGQIPRIYTT